MVTEQQGETEEGEFSWFHEQGWYRFDRGSCLGIYDDMFQQLSLPLFCSYLLFV